MLSTEVPCLDSVEFVTITTYTTQSTFATGSETSSPPTDRLPSEMTLPEADRLAEMSYAESALRDAREVLTTITVSKIWEGSL